MVENKIRHRNPYKTTSEIWHQVKVFKVVHKCKNSNIAMDKLILKGLEAYKNEEANA